MGTDCPYRTLGVRADAHGQLIRSAYRARLKTAHPDHGGSREELERVLDAYAELRRRGALDRPAPHDDPYARLLHDLAAVAPAPPARQLRHRRRPRERFDDVLRAAEIRRTAHAPL
jgi:hypothetical protein